jgi:hypothetical protein
MTTTVPVSETQTFTITEDITVRASLGRRLRSYGQMAGSTKVLTALRGR